MADGSNDFELFSAPAASEKDEKADEKFREEMKRGQQAMQQLQRDEGQAKGYDYSLAAIIVQFLSQPQNTDLFLLVSRVVSLNIPSELVIAVLSLVDKKAHQVTRGFLAEGKGAEAGRHAHSALALHNQTNFDGLSPEHKKTIEGWVGDIAQVAGKSPQRMVETLVVLGAEKHISTTVVQLGAFILRNYLAAQQVAIGYEELRGFMES
ncbi:hypothetical protein HZA44_04270, partial [Candidatus Peregrinibacteria bacterium]|nr:hypothetical protein [Candidatus Peregrinibacteria bacterium]